jgi:hypothetical protein
MVRLYYSTIEDWDGNEFVSEISLFPIDDCYYVDLNDSETWNLDTEEKLPYTGTFRLEHGFYDPETKIFGDEDTDSFYDEDDIMYDRVYEANKYQKYENGQPVGEPYFEEA